ncbi:hypothetical protein AB3S75_020651 [Citrus x aurantiifolia]
MVDLRFETPNLSVFGYTGNVRIFLVFIYMVHCLCRKPISISAPPQKYDSQWYVVKYIEHLSSKVPSGFQIVEIAQLALTMRYI